MASESETFALRLSAFAKQAPEQIRVAVRKVSIDLLTNTVYRTPVGNPKLWKSKPPKGYVGGRLRANWTVALTAPNITTTDAIDKDGGATITTGVAVIATADGTQDIFITNSLPYAIPIEYGHSGVQAPAGMVRVTVTELQMYVDKAAAEIKANEQ